MLQQITQSREVKDNRITVDRIDERNLRRARWMLGYVDVRRFIVERREKSIKSTYKLEIADERWLQMQRECNGESYKSLDDSGLPRAAKNVRVPCCLLSRKRIHAIFVPTVFEHCATDVARLYILAQRFGCEQKREASERCQFVVFEELEPFIWRRNSRN